MSSFTLNITNPIPLVLLIPTYKIISGVNKPIYPTIEESLNIKDEKGDWYRPDIKGNCRIAREDGATYDIIGEPENISMRNQFLKFKVRRVKGGA